MTRTLGMLLVVLAGCCPSSAPTSSAKVAEKGGAEEQEVFGLKAGGDVKPAPFDGKRALKYIEAICAIGPRQSGTKGMREQIALITKHFEELGQKVERQNFSGKQISRQEPVEMTNLIVRFHPEREKRVILCSHYDTRPIADQEPDPRKWHETFVSANDGGSGVAFLMELARHMKDLKVNVGVDFVLFDGEEYIFDNRRIGGDEYFFGSKHFAEEYKKNKGKVRYGAAVLLDMIAGHDARFPIEQNSWLKSRKLVEQIWEVAREQKSRMFENVPGDTVTDDHIQLQDVGIPAIDIIDFSYKHWHRLTDVPSNCSAESLDGVARVLTVWLQRVQP
jgi:glutaminyl-peptide cyclotransferase